MPTKTEASQQLQGAMLRLTGVLSFTTENLGSGNMPIPGGSSDGNPTNRV